MSAGKVTQVYDVFYPGDSMSLWPSWPKQEKPTSLVGDAADELMSHRNWYCYNLVGPVMDTQDRIVGHFKIWRCFNFQTGEMFEIDQESWPFEERFMRLATALEVHSGQTGLIIMAQ